MKKMTKCVTVVDHTAKMRNVRCAMTRNERLNNDGSYRIAGAIIAEKYLSSKGKIYCHATAFTDYEKYVGCWVNEDHPFFALRKMWTKRQDLPI
jgi:hypothetical protein